MSKKPTKQAYLSRLCQLIGIEDLPVGVGSSLPRPLFDALAQLFNVSTGGSMPEVGERVATAAGVPWDPTCDSRATYSGGGSTVTSEGLRRLLKAVEVTYARDLGELADSSSMGVSIGEGYREADGTVSRSRSQPTTDWCLTSEGTKEHAATQNALARYLSDVGVLPLSPRAQDPQFDLAWASQGRFAIAEVKSVRPQNMVDQVRLGVGQVLHYAHQIAVRTGADVPATVIVTSRPITPELAVYLERNGISSTDAQALTIGSGVRLPCT